MASRVKASDQTLEHWVDDLQATGRYTFTHADVGKAHRRSEIAIEAALRRLKRKGRIVSPRRGFFVLVPVEYRAAGCPPATWFVADLMRFLGQPYYVGILSAASLHGAAHQQPMTFQVVTDRPTRPARAGRVRIEFHMSRVLARTPIVELPTDTGSIRVASPEATAFDLVRYPAAAGYLDNAATVLGELAERVAPEALERCAREQALPDVQRLGYLLQQLGRQDRAKALEKRLVGERLRPVLLAPERSRGRARPDPLWRVVPNEKIEIDQ